MEIGAQQVSDSLMLAPELAVAYRLFGCAAPVGQFHQVGAVVGGVLGGVRHAAQRHRRRWRRHPARRALHTAWGPSKIPDYLRKANPYGGDSVVDCSLRVALRKLHKMPFICLFDAGDVAVQPWPTRLLRGLVRFATPRAVAKAAPGKTFWRGL